MDIEDAVREKIKSEEMDRRDKMQQWPVDVDSEDISFIIDNMSNSEFLRVLSDSFNKKVDKC